MFDIGKKRKSEREIEREVRERDTGKEGRRERGRQEGKKVLLDHIHFQMKTYPLLGETICQCRSPTRNMQGLALPLH